MTDTPVITIATHDGNFHADEILAVAILTTLFPHHNVIRTRDENVLEAMDIVVDVGGIYDPVLRRYDHHLSSPPVDRNGHLFSSAGLVWLHYGKTYLTTIGIPKDAWVDKQYVDLLELVEKQIRIQWIYPVDRADNGVAQGPTPISELVGSMRPIDPEKTRSRSNELFFEAVSMVSHVFKRSCFHAADHAINTAQYTATEKQLMYDDRVLVVNHSVKNYKSFKDTPLHFVVSMGKEYIDSDPYFIIRVIPSIDSPNYKTPFPQNLLGKRQSELEELTGISGITYVHHGGYMAHTTTRDAAIALCRLLLNITED